MNIQPSTPASPAARHMETPTQSQRDAHSAAALKGPEVDLASPPPDYTALAFCCAGRGEAAAAVVQLFAQQAMLFKIDIF